MIRHDHDDVARALRQALPPAGEGAPRHDLWPAVARRVSAPRPRPARVEWVLAGAAALWLLFVPQGVAALLYLL
jgi:hypothetical protein